MRYPRTPPIIARLLVVDDDEDIRDSLVHFLGGALKDVDVIGAASGPAALQVIRETKVDGIVTDYRMPGMDGLTFLAAARKLRPEAAALLMTAYADVVLAEKAVNEHRVAYFVIKPLNPETLVSYVADMLWRGARQHRMRGLVGMTREMGATRAPLDGAGTRGIRERSG